MRKTKRIITESERQADLMKRQQAIIESFGEEFNKIKRVNEDEGEDNLMRHIDNRRADLEMQLKSAIIKVVDIEVASRTLETPQGAVMDPFTLMYRTIKSGFAKIEDVDARFVESAIETMESQDHPEGYGFGSSDGTYLMGDFLSDAGYNVDYSSGRMVVTKGGINEYGDDGYPAGAANDPRAPYNQITPEYNGEWEVQDADGGIDDISFICSVDNGGNHAWFNVFLYELVNLDPSKMNIARAYVQNPFANESYIDDMIQDYWDAGRAEIEMEEYDGGYDDYDTDEINEMDPVGDGFGAEYEQKPSNRLPSFSEIVIEAITNWEVEFDGDNFIYRIDSEDEVGHYKSGNLSFNFEWDSEQDPSMSRPAHFIVLKSFDLEFCSGDNCEFGEENEYGNSRKFFSLLDEKTKRFMNHKINEFEKIMEKDAHDNYDGRTGDEMRDNGLSWSDFI